MKASNESMSSISLSHLIDNCLYPLFVFSPNYCSGGSSLTNEKDHHYFLNRFVCVGEFFDG